MRKPTKGPVNQKRVWCFLEALLTRAEDIPEIKSHWEKENTDRPELVIHTKRRFLETLAQLKKEQIDIVINLLDELNIWDDRRLNQKQGSEIGKFALRLWSLTDVEKNRKEFEKLWEASRTPKSKELEATSQKTPKTAEVIKSELDWRDICHKMLEAQQESARLRRKATEKGFEINVHVPLGLVERKHQQRQREHENRELENVYALEEEVIVKTYEHGTFLQEVIGQEPARNHNKHIAIIGEPGAGKTTLLSKIASFIKDKPEELPIFISIANLQGNTLEDYLLKIWLPQAMKLGKPNVVVTPEIENQLIERFSKGGVWLLLDGVDEIGESSPIHKIHQELTEWLRQARVVLTCRLNVWDTNVNNTLTGFDIYKTQEFKLEQIDDFIQQWFTCAEQQQRGEELKLKLKETKHEKIRKLVTNPLRLALLCQTFDIDQGELPETKAALYQRFSLYFYEWKSEQVRKLINSENLKNKLHQALSKLAFADINSTARFRLKRSLAQQEMGEKLFKLACDVGWLNLVDRVAGSDEEVYAFFHPNFQEYFAAKQLIDGDNKTEPLSNFTVKQWRETFLLALQMKKSADEIALFMKKSIDRILLSDDKLQNFLMWVHEKSLSINSQYKQTAIRTFYFGLASGLDMILNRTFNKGIVREINNDVFRGLIRGAIPELDRALMGTLELILFSPLQDYNDLRKYSNHSSYACAFIRDEIYPLDCESNFNQALQELKVQLPNPETEWNIFQQWRKNEGLAWAKKLRKVMKIYRNIGHDWQFSEQQIELLKQYFYANVFLIECVNNCDLTGEVKEKITATLLLPIKLNINISIIQSLQTAIKNDPQLSQTIHLICIDTSNFIEPDNPAAEIYAEMVAQGCPERTAGEPATMQALKVYWKLLKSDKRVVLVFYQGMGLQSQQLSDRFLNDLSKFYGSICVISNQIIENVNLKFFTPSQSIDDVLLWLWTL